MTTSPEWWTSVLAGEGGDLSTSGDGERYLVLPSRGNARVVVDATNPAAIRDAAARMVSTRGLPGSNQLAQVAAAAAPRLSQSWLASNDGAQTLREHLRGILGRSVTLSIAIGPPRPNQKPVIRVYDGEDVVAIAKMGPDRHTAAMVANEGNWLRDLQANPIPGVLTADVVHSGMFGASQILVMSRLPLLDDVGVSFDAVPNELLRAISKRAESEGLGQSAYWKALLVRAEPFADAELERLLKRVESHAQFDLVATGLWHGDWSPWNIGRGTSGQWCIWDWERSAVGVPLAADLLHLHLQYGPEGIVGGLTGAAQASRRCGHLDEDVDLATNVYLTELLIRHHEAGDTGTPRDAEVRQLIASRADIA